MTSTTQDAEARLRDLLRILKVSAFPIDALLEVYGPNTAAGIGLRDDLDAVLAARRPEQEPVAWVSPKQLANHKDPETPPGGHYLPVRKTRDGQFTLALYATPQAGKVGAVTDAMVEAAKVLLSAKLENPEFFLPRKDGPVLPEVRVRHLRTLLAYIASLEGSENAALAASPAPAAPKVEEITADTILKAIKDQGFGFTVVNGRLTVGVDQSVGIDLARMAAFLSAAASPPAALAVTGEGEEADDADLDAFRAIVHELSGMGHSNGNTMRALTIAKDAVKNHEDFRAALAATGRPDQGRTGA